jgi:hypothetical protein
METMRSRREPSSFKSYPAEKVPLRHRCPVCRTLHEVSPARSQFAYGRQLACSPDCEAERRRRNRAMYRVMRLQGSGNPHIKPNAVLTSVQDTGTTARFSTTGEGPNNPNSPRHHNPLRLVPAGEHKAVISATVESTDVLHVRRAIFQAAGESVGILKTAPVPHSSRVRVFIDMKLDALDSIMTAIMRSVAACEFGRVVRM